jgi:flagellar protein FliO/FliZ
VGSRERVVVLAIADRLIVVGVASGQVSSLANLEVNTANLAEVLPPGSGEANVGAESFTDTFAVWLKQSTGKILEKKDSSK